MSNSENERLLEVWFEDKWGEWLDNNEPELTKSLGSLSDSDKLKVLNWLQDAFADGIKVGQNEDPIFGN